MVACPKGCHMLVRTSINCHYLYLFVVGFQFWNNGGHIPFGSIWIILGFVWIGFVLVYFKFNMMKHWILTGFWGVTWTLCEPGEVGRFAEGTLGGGGCGSPTAEGGWKPWEGSRFGRTAAECALVDESIGKCIQSDEVWWGLMMSDVVGVAVYGCLWPFWGKVRLRDVLMVVAYFLIFEWEAEAASAATVDRRVCDWQISPLHVTRFLETLERLFQVAIPSCNCAHKTWPKTWPCSRATCEATQQKMQSCLDLKRHFQAQTISWVDEVDFHLLDPFSIWKKATYGNIKLTFSELGDRETPTKIYKPSPCLPWSDDLIPDARGLRGQIRIFTAAVKRLSGCLDPEEKEKRQPFLQQLKEDALLHFVTKADLAPPSFSPSPALADVPTGKQKDCWRRRDFEGPCRPCIGHVEQSGIQSLDLQFKQLFTKCLCPKTGS